MGNCFMLAARLGDFGAQQITEVSAWTFLKISPCFHFGRIFSLNWNWIYEYFDASKTTLSNGLTAFWKKIRPDLIALLEMTRAL